MYAARSFFQRGLRRPFTSPRCFEPEIYGRFSNAVSLRGLGTSSDTADAIVIGAGVIGNSIATELSRKGWRTVNVEKQRGSGQGSTGYSSGICRMMYSIIDSVKFAWEGYTYYENWAEHIGVPCEEGYARLRQCGGLVVRSPCSQTYLDRVLASYDAIGLEYQVLTASEIESRFGFDLSCYGPPTRIDDDRFGLPNEQHPRLQEGVFFPQAGYVSDPSLAALNLQRAAEATGRASFRFNTAVEKILRAGGEGSRVSGVRLSDGTEVHAPVVINAAGPHSSQITAMLFEQNPDENDMRITTRAMRQEVSYLNAPSEWARDADTGELEGIPFCADGDVGIYFRPEVGGKILIGSIEPECDHPTHIYPSDPESVYPGNADSSLTDQWTNQVYRAALRIPTLDLPDATNTQGITACYDVTEDWAPVYDRSAVDGYYMAIGTSGNQFKNAGVAGRLMSEIVVACENGHDHDRDPLRFELNRIPKPTTINTASFSRLRDLNVSSGSVVG